MNQISDIGANDLSAFAFPPAPEKVESREYIDVIANIRSDDILYGGLFDSIDIQSSMILVNEAVQKYAEYYDQEVLLENSMERIDDVNNSTLDVNSVLYEFMSTNDKLSELTKMIGRLRFAIEGNENALAQEAETDIENLSKHLPSEYEIAKITNAAKSSDVFGSKLTDLWLKRCFHLTQQEFVEIVQIDEEIGVKLSPDYTRIAIQNARQKIIQKLKEAEAKVIYEEFRSRQGELINGIVRRISRGTIVVDIGRTEAIIPYDEQVPREYFQPKDRLRAVLLKIEDHFHLQVLLMIVLIIS